MKLILETWGVFEGRVKVVEDIGGHRGRRGRLAGSSLSILQLEVAVIFLEDERVPCSIVMLVLGK